MPQVAHPAKTGTGTGQPPVIGDMREPQSEAIRHA